MPGRKAAALFLFNSSHSAVFGDGLSRLVFDFYLKENAEKPMGRLQRKYRPRREASWYLTRQLRARQQEEPGWGRSREEPSTCSRKPVWPAGPSPRPHGQPGCAVVRG